MKRILVAFIGFFALSFGLNAQDIHFSQYNATPLLLNPALAGINECDVRLGANYKSQWSTVSAGKTYRTIAAGVDMTLAKRAKHKNFAGLGIQFVADQAGDLNFNTNRLELDFAYHFVLNSRGTHSFSAALQGGVTHRSLDLTKAIFNNQIDADLLISNTPGESLHRESFFFGDAGLGLLWSISPTKISNAYMGIAFTHLNQPNQSFGPNNTGIDLDEKLYMKSTIHGGGLLGFSDKVALMPSFLLLKQGPSEEVNLGTYFKYKFSSIPSERTAMYFGVFTRLNNQFDAIIFAGRYDFAKFSVGISYDFNVSKLSPASNAAGGPEISIIYTGCFNRGPQTLFCPAL